MLFFIDLSTPQTLILFPKSHSQLQSPNSNLRPQSQTLKLIIKTNSIWLWHNSTLTTSVDISVIFVTSDSQAIVEGSREGMKKSWRVGNLWPAGFVRSGQRNLRQNRRRLDEKGKLGQQASTDVATTSDKVAMVAFQWLYPSEMLSGPLKYNKNFCGIFSLLSTT